MKIESSVSLLVSYPYSIQKKIEEFYQKFPLVISKTQLSGLTFFSFSFVKLTKEMKDSFPLPDSQLELLRNAYMLARKNGDEIDNPKEDIPFDGTYTIQYMNNGDCKIWYEEGEGDRKWMEERDKNYLKRLWDNGELKIREPVVCLLWWSDLLCRENTNNNNIKEWWANKLLWSKSNLDMTLKQTEKEVTPEFMAELEKKVAEQRQELPNKQAMRKQETTEQEQTELLQLTYPYTNPEMPCDNTATSMSTTTATTLFLSRHREKVGKKPDVPDLDPAAPTLHEFHT